MSSENIPELVSIDLDSLPIEDENNTITNTITNTIIIKSYIQNNNNKILLLPDLDKEEVIKELGHYSYDEIDSTSESLFECLIKQNASNYILMDDFDINSFNKREVQKINNIMDKLVNYGQSIIIFGFSQAKIATTKELFITI